MSQKPRICFCLCHFGGHCGVASCQCGRPGDFDYSVKPKSPRVWIMEQFFHGRDASSITDDMVLADEDADMIGTYAAMYFGVTVRMNFPMSLGDMISQLEFQTATQQLADMSRRFQKNVY